MKTYSDEMNKKLNHKLNRGKLQPIKPAPSPVQGEREKEIKDAIQEAWSEPRNIAYPVGVDLENADEVRRWHLEHSQDTFGQFLDRAAKRVAALYPTPSPVGEPENPYLDEPNGYVWEQCSAAYRPIIQGLEAQVEKLTRERDEAYAEGKSDGLSFVDSRIQELEEEVENLQKQNKILGQYNVELESELSRLKQDKPVEEARDAM